MTPGKQNIEYKDYVSDNTPGIFSVKDYVEIVKRVDGVIGIIRKSDGARIIILETWLLLDWFVRHILAQGIGMVDNPTDNFDLRYEILPQSFRTCLRSLRKYIKMQNGLKKNAKTPPVPLRMSGAFIRYIMKKYTSLWNDILHAEDEYLKLQGVDTSRRIWLDPPRKKGHRTVSEVWIESVSKLDKKWFDNAEKINEMRNIAAHSFSREEIYKLLDITGIDSIKELRKWCILMLQKMLGLRVRVNAGKVEESTIARIYAR